MNARLAPSRSRRTRLPHRAMQVFAMGVGEAILVVAAQGVSFLPVFLGQLIHEHDRSEFQRDCERSAVSARLRGKQSGNDDDRVRSRYCLWGRIGIPSPVFRTPDTRDGPTCRNAWYRGCGKARFFSYSQREANQARTQNVLILFRCVMYVDLSARLAYSVRRPSNSIQPPSRRLSGSW